MADAPVTLNFPDYPPARYSALRLVLVQKGLRLDGNEGQIKEFGADVSYAYDGVTNLTLLVRSAPHWHSMKGFEDGLKAAINGVAN